MGVVHLIHVLRVRSISWDVAHVRTVFGLMGGEGIEDNRERRGGK